MRRDEEVERAVKAFEKAVAASDRPMPSKTLQPIETPTEDLISTRRVFETNGKTPQSAPIPIRPSITEYTSGELQALLRWVQSDGKLRTHDEIADEMFVALPFNRRGARIEVALRKASSLGKNQERLTTQGGAIRSIVGLSARSEFQRER
jgi:hypothetical protein